MMKTKAGLIASLCFLVCTGSVHAGNRPGAVTVSAGAGYYFFAPRET